MSRNRMKIRINHARAARQSGFTIIEVMVVVALLAIVSVIAAPSLRDMVARNRITGAASDLQADLQLARAESNRRGQRVGLCKSSSDNSTCDASAGSWSNGWIVYVDANSSNTFDSGEEILRVHQALPTTVTLTGAPSGDPSVRAVYRPTGPVDGGTARTFTVCQTGFLGRVVSVAATGRTSVASTASAC